MESTDISILEAVQVRDIINDFLGISQKKTDKTIPPKKKTFINSSIAIIKKAIT